MKKLVTLTGSYSYPSKTLSLTDTIAHKAVTRYNLLLKKYSMNDLGETLGLAKEIDDLEDSGKKVVKDLQEADAIIITTPVYKGSYPGLFKHFIDLLDPATLYSKPILIAATGGGTRHALMVEHQLRPLFGFFMAHSLPTAVYASAQDYSPNNAISSLDLLRRIDQAIEEFSPFIKTTSENYAENLDFIAEKRLNNLSSPIEKVGGTRQ